jgi:ABC-type glycerol-3-phosphate transport system permease component
MRKRGIRKRRLLKLCLYGVIVVLLTLMLFPLYWMFRTSSVTGLEVFDYPPSFWPKKMSLQAYEQIFARQFVMSWYLNSLVVTAFTLLLTIPCAAMTGYSLSRFRKAETTIVGNLILLAKMLPISLLTIPLYVMFARVKLLDTLVCLILAYTTFAIPFCTWMLKGFFDGLPRELEEAAEVDGCSLMGGFLRITIPLAKPGIAAAAIYTAVISWGEFIFARTFMRTPGHWTIGIGIVSFKQQYDVRWNEVMAASLIFTIPLLIIFALFERYLIKGLTMGSIK